MNGSCVSTDDEAQAQQVAAHSTQWAADKDGQRACSYIHTIMANYILSFCRRPSGRPAGRCAGPVGSRQGRRSGAGPHCAAAGPPGAGGAPGEACRGGQLCGDSCASRAHAAAWRRRDEGTTGGNCALPPDIIQSYIICCYTNLKILYIRLQCHGVRADDWCHAAPVSIAGSAIH